MAKTRKPVPKSQVELSQETINPLINQGKAPVPANKRRENQRSLKGDDVKQMTVGLQDVDEAIVYYFNNVIRPSVIQNGAKINVPILYGSPERWAAVQKDGFYRDKNGKIQVPLIMFKRDSVTRNRNLGNKLDANNPVHFGIFEKKYSNKNIYDRFGLLTNRIPVKEYYGVIMPDYVDLVYSCTVFTEYVEQMNKIVESINFASDSYWGDPERFSFRAAIDDYTTVTETIQGGDRTVKTTFSIKIAGYIIPDGINTAIKNPNKFYSKASLSFKLETAGSSEILNARSSTPEKAAPSRFFDTALTVAKQEGLGMTPEQITFVSTSTSAVTSTTSGGDTAIFSGKAFITPPVGFSVTQEDFKVYVNGQFVSTNLRTVTDTGSSIQVVFSGLGYEIGERDQIVIVGKLV